MWVPRSNLVVIGSEPRGTSDRYLIRWSISSALLSRSGPKQTIILDTVKFEEGNLMPHSKVEEPSIVLLTCI